MPVESASFQPQHGGGGGMFYMRRRPKEEERDEKDEGETAEGAPLAAANDWFKFQQARRSRLSDQLPQREHQPEIDTNDLRARIRVLTMGVLRLEQRWRAGLAR